ncbi:MAG: hypothetical protein HRT35_00335 [Algicola sp.]|nr:hypothetical protein [Algicola sp.]
MSTLSPSKEFPLNIADQPPGLLVTEDAEFGFCGQLKSGSNLSFGTAGAMGLVTAAFTTSVWIKLDDLSCAMTFAADHGWAVLAGGKLQLVGGEAVAGLIAGQWHYVTWRVDDCNNQLYLDGSLIQSVTVTKTPCLSDAQALEYVVSASEALVAHQHFYGHALTPPEIMLDRASRLPSAASSFTQYYPLDFKVSNIDTGAFAGYPDNNLFIVDSTADELITQQLNICNASDQVIHFEPFAAELPIETNHHLCLSIRNAVFTQPGKNPQITALREDPDWQIVRADNADPQDGCWLIYLRCRKTLVLAANASQDFEFKYHSADGALGARSTRMLLSYQGLRFDFGGDIQGDRNKRLDILNLSSNNAYIGRMNDSINNADKKVDDLKDKINQQLDSLTGGSDTTLKDLNERITGLDTEQESRYSLISARVESLETGYPLRAYHDAPQTTICNERGELNIYLYNRSESTVVLSADAQIKLRLPFGDKASDLGQTHVENGSAVGVTVNGTSANGFAKRTNPTNGATVYQWSPGQQTELSRGNAVILCIDNLLPNAAIGTSFIDITLKGIVGCQDVTMTVAVTKQDPTYPNGIIVMWSGVAEHVPTGWAICDGRYGTPDLQDRFILACPSGVAPGTQGGSHSYSLSGSQLPTHTHTVNDGGHSHAITDRGHTHQNGLSARLSSTDVDDDSLPIYARNKTTSQNNTSSDTTGISINSSGANITVASAGSSGSIDNRPEYHTLYYIMKLGDIALQAQQNDDDSGTDSVSPTASTGGKKRVVRRRRR